MYKVELKEGIYWVGGIDWDLRDFHGYKTQRGSTYNAYLIIDEKIVLVDTVKHYLFDEMLRRIKQIVDPAKIDYIVSNHVEMDHSGSIPRMMEMAPNAKIITSTMGEKGLKRHYKEDWDLQVVRSGDTLDIGERTLRFIHTPMVHWPDNMVTYIEKDRVLLSNDAFGQHIASTERFDDQFCWDILREEAAKYFANIVLPYCENAKKALKALEGLEIDIIAPSHGYIWRKYVNPIMEQYDDWVNYRSEAKALIIYDTMWGSTEKMAYALREGLLNAGAIPTMRNLKKCVISDIIAEVLDTKMIILGSSTINNGMLASMGGFLTYIRGLRPKEKIGMAFGSYGWGGQAVHQIEEVIREMGWKMPEKGLRIKFVPDQSELDEVKAIGSRLGKLLMEK